ncbi:MAG: hypothetical protein QXT68_07240 [Halobacteria archaeon]
MRGWIRPKSPSACPSVDEKFISLSGRMVPALVVRDATTRIIPAVRVLPDRSPEAIGAVLRPVVEATRAHTIVTDDHRSYPVVARNLGLRHQLCQTHLLRKLNRKLHVYLSRKRWGTLCSALSSSSTRLGVEASWRRPGRSPQAGQGGGGPRAHAGSAGGEPGTDPLDESPSHPPYAPAVRLPGQFPVVTRSLPG